MEDDEIEALDSPVDSDRMIAYFLKEQMGRFDALAEAALAASEDDPVTVQEFVAYVRGAVAAMDEALTEAWPELRDIGAFSPETSRKLSMLTALCGVMVNKAKVLAETDSLIAKTMALMTYRLVEDGSVMSASTPSKAVSVAVTSRIMADEHLHRARQSEAKGRK